MNNTLKDKCSAALLSVFVGDAFALPVECQSPDNIKKIYGYLDRFVDNTNHPYSTVASCPAASISDDSQLQLALMSSLERSKCLDLEDLKKAHIEAYDSKWGQPIGWGGTTKQSIQKMKAGEKETFIQDGAGNGPVIKIAPLAVYYILTAGKKYADGLNSSLLRDCQAISKLTHNENACVIAAYCHAKTIIRAIQGELPDKSRDIAQIIIDDALYAEKNLKIGSDFSDRLYDVLLVEFNCEQGTFCAFDLETSIVSKMICQKQSSWIYNSYPLTAYCIAKYVPYKNFMYTITQTANAGGDADSNTSMVGAVMGGLLGETTSLKRMLQFLPNAKELSEQVDLFLGTF